ncbi:MAG: CpaD family pilus assembly lipoprotein [Pseudomonadota bacterium]
MISSLRNTAIIVFSSFLVACSSTSDPLFFAEPVVPAKIMIERKTGQLVLPYSGGHAGLSHRSLHRLRAFVLAFSEGDIDSTHLAITLPGGKPRNDIGRVLRDLRIPSDNGVWLNSNNRHSRQIIVDAELYKAIPPDCRPRSIKGAQFNNNDGDIDIGCSNVANLARAVVDKKDLVGRDFAELSRGERATDAFAPQPGSDTGEAN